MDVPERGEHLVTTSMRILPEEKLQLKRLARLEDRSVSQTARRLLQEQLRRMASNSAR